MMNFVNFSFVCNYSIFDIWNNIECLNSFIVFSYCNKHYNKKYKIPGVSYDEIDNALKYTDSSFWDYERPFENYLDIDKENNNEDLISTIRESLLTDELKRFINSGDYIKLFTINDPSLIDKIKILIDNIELKDNHTYYIGVYVQQLEKYNNTYKKDFIFDLDLKSPESIVFTLQQISSFLIAINWYEAFNSIVDNSKFSLKVSLEDKTIYQRKIGFIKNPKEFKQTLYKVGCSLINSYWANNLNGKINLSVQVDI